MQVNDIDIDKIKPYPRNAKTHPDEQVEQIAKSIEKFGWAQPLVIDGDGVVVIGHGRLMAAKKLGLTSVPCVEIDGLTDEEIRMLRLADNKLNESPMDMDILALELEDLDFEGWDLDFGFIEDEGFGTDFTLPDGEQPGIRTMSFQLRVEQKELIDYALERVENEITETFGNVNKKGNALYEVVRQWAELRK